MVNPLRLSSQPEAQAEEQRQEELLQDYLDHLCAPLIGTLPYGRRQEIRLEAEGHLLALIAEQREAGLDPAKATETALKLYGAPNRLGQAIVETWSAGEGGRIQPTRYRRMATIRAFACSSLPTALSFLLVENNALTGAGTQRPLWILVWLFASPPLAGALSGWIIPTRSSRAVFRAGLILSLYGLLLGLTLLPQWEGLELTLFQLLYGLPAGALTASLLEALRRHRLRSTFRPAPARL